MPRRPWPRRRTTWYLAEGATHSGFNLFYLLQNPNATAATVQVTLPAAAPAAPLGRPTRSAANSRFNIWVNDEGGPVLASADVSADVSAIVDHRRSPIIVERAMYLNAGGQVVRRRPRERRRHRAGDAAGSWPKAPPALLRPVRADRQSRTTRTRGHGDVPAAERARRRQDATPVAPRAGSTSGWTSRTPRLADTAVSTTSRRPTACRVIVERAMWWPGDGATLVRSAQLARRDGDRHASGDWPRAKSAAPAARETYILIANTSAVAGVGAA